MRHRGIVWVLLAAAACLGGHGRADAAEAPPKGTPLAEPAIRVGDKVRVKAGPAPVWPSSRQVRPDDQPLMEVSAGTILSVLGVRGKMIGVSVDLGGRTLKGWIDGSRYLEPLRDDTAMVAGGERKAATVAITLKRQGDLESVPLPEVEEAVAALLGRTGFVQAAPTATTADATLEVQVTGIALDGSVAPREPGRVEPIYSGAKVVGSVRLEARGGRTHAAEFSGTHPPPPGAAGPKERMKAPFEDALRASNFCNALLAVFAKVWGDHMLVCAVQKTSSGYALVRNLDTTAIALLSSGVPRPDTLLLEALADTNVRARRGAARALGDATLAAKVNTPAIAQALADTLQDDDEEVRGYATLALARFGEGTPAGALAVGLKDPDPEARIAAIQALGSIRSPEARSLLVNALADPDPGVRVNAIWRLHDLQDPALAPSLIALASSDKVPRVRAEAARLLGELRDRRAADALAAIAACKDKQFPGHEPKDVDEMREQAVRALRRVDAAKALPILTAAVKDRSLRVRQTAAQELGALRSPEAVPGLLAAVTDEHEALYNSSEHDYEWIVTNLREDALDALGAIKSRRAVDPLIEALHLIHLPKRVTDRIGDTLVRITGRTFADDFAGEPTDYESWRVWWDARLRDAREAP